MAVAFALLLSLFCFLQLAERSHAAALTTAIGANERVCFYADVDKAGEKIGVCLPASPHRAFMLTVTTLSSTLRYAQCKICIYVSQFF